MNPDFNQFRENILSQISGVQDPAQKSLLALHMIAGAGLAITALHDEAYLAFGVQLAALTAGIIRFGWEALQAEMIFHEAASEEEMDEIINAMKDRPEKLN